jgi:NADPH-dependent F420 reductase
VLIGVLGGTGPAGRGLAARLASTGHDVVVGSRDAARAEAVVAELGHQWGDRVATLTPADNAGAAEAGIAVIGTVWDAAVATARDHADALAGKPVVSIANGLTKRGRAFVPLMPPEGSLAAAIQAVVPTGRVVATLHHVPAALLGDLDQPVDCDVFVAGDDDEARNLVLELVGEFPGANGIDAGGLANAVGLESFTAALLTANLRHTGEGRLRVAGIGARRQPAERPA